MLPWTPLLLAAQSAAWAGELHVPSPDWRDQVVYFLMTDRFFDGDPANNGQGAGEYDPGDPNRYHGGDLAGVRSRLGYIQGLGATAVWLTPPVANVWWDPALKMAGYHGYWTENFREVDRHLGTLDDYRKLSRALHGRGMFLIQDMVANHTGDFFTVEGGEFKPKAGVVPPRPTQPPFDRLDDRVYHRRPDIKDFNDEADRLTGQLSGLDDLNTSGAEVREALRASYGHWIASAGVDGFRIDTAHYVEHDFWRDFVHSRSTSAPGVRVLAESTGRGDFFSFGEVWVHAAPNSDDAERVAASYLGTREAPELDAALNFPLADDLRAIFAKGEPPSRLAYRLEGLNRHFRGGRASVNFLDNHDMPRFLAEGPEAGLRQALAALLTIPGIPVIYAGTEQGLRETRSSMPGFERAHPLYALIKELTALRKRHRAFSRGRLHALFGASAGPGLLAYRVEGGAERLLILMNTSDEATLAANLETGLAPLAELAQVYSQGIDGGKAAVDELGRLSLKLPGRAVVVYRETARRAPRRDGAAAITIDPFDPRPMIKPLQLYGGARDAGRVLLVVDGRIDRATPAPVSFGGRWAATLDAPRLADGEHTLVVVAADDAAGPAVSATSTFSVRIPWTETQDAADPVGDDRGPRGTYRYPLAPGFEGRGDITRVTVSWRGSDVRVRIKLARGLSTAWNPPNGFDHLSLDLLVDAPALRGSRTPPGGAGVLPAEMDWDYHVFLGGWKTSLTDGSGRELRPPPSVRADKDAGTIDVTLFAEALPGLDDPATRLYLKTWDYDGVEDKPRPLAPEPADYVFGGGEPSDPPVLDEVGPFPLKGPP